MTCHDVTAAGSEAEEPRCGSYRNMTAAGVNVSETKTQRDREV